MATIVWVSKLSPRNLKVRAFKVSQLHSGTSQMRLHFCGSNGNTEEALVFKNTIWPRQHHTLSSLERTPGPICSPRRQAPSRASFQKPAPFPTWIAQELCFFKLHCESFEVSPPSCCEVVLPQRTVLASGSQQWRSLWRPRFPHLSDAAPFPSFHLHAMFETLRFLIPTSILAEFSCLNSNPALCL